MTPSISPNRASGPQNQPAPNVAVSRPAPFAESAKGDDAVLGAEVAASRLRLLNMVRSSGRGYVPGIEQAPCQKTHRWLRGAVGRVTLCCRAIGCVVLGLFGSLGLPWCLRFFGRRSVVGTSVDRILISR